MGSKNDRSNGVHAFNVENSDTETEGDHPSDMRELRNPARPLYQNSPNLAETIISDEDPEDEDYHIPLNEFFQTSTVDRYSILISCHQFSMAENRNY